MPRLITALGAAAAAVALSAALALPAAAAQQNDRPQGSPEYYLSLGDSLSVGDQPNAQGVTLPTNQGYADQLYWRLAVGGNANLRLVKLGCPGETTGTLLNGGICGYSGDQRTSLTGDAGNQLAAALTFLQEHPGRVKLITIDIGANDLNPCVVLGSIPAVAACAQPVIATVGQHTAAILAALHAAAPQATIVGMTYYVPELAAWLTGPAGQAFAAGAVQLGQALNGVLTADFGAIGAPVADVSGAFKSTDFTDTVTLPGLGTLPENVALVCLFTWECTPFHNEHANVLGYGVIAQAFYAALPARLGHL
jgi:lysophospholipase L1-like esterase